MVKQFFRKVDLGKGKCTKECNINIGQVNISQ